MQNKVFDPLLNSKNYTGKNVLNIRTVILHQIQTLKRKSFDSRKPEICLYLIFFPFISCLLHIIRQCTFTLLRVGWDLYRIRKKVMFMFYFRQLGIKGVTFYLKHNLVCSLFYIHTYLYR